MVCQRAYVRGLAQKLSATNAMASRKLATMGEGFSEAAPVPMRLNQAAIHQETNWESPSRRATPSPSRSPMAPVSTACGLPLLPRGKDLQFLWGLHVDRGMEICTESLPHLAYFPLSAQCTTALPRGVHMHAQTPPKSRGQGAMDVSSPAGKSKLLPMQRSKASGAGAAGSESPGSASPVPGPALSSQLSALRLRLWDGYRPKRPGCMMRSVRSSLSSFGQDLDNTDGPDVPATPKKSSAGGAAERLRSSVRYFGSLVINPSGSADYLSTGGNLILMRSSVSTTSFSGDGDDRGRGRCCAAKSYYVPQSTLRRGFVKLESRYSSDAPGDLPPSIILGALRRFDAEFRPGRNEIDRLNLIEQLAHSERDIGKVKWNCKELLQAFFVKMNPFERLYFTVDVGGTSSLLSRAVSAIMVAAIVISIAIWMAGTMVSFSVVPCVDCEPEPLPWMQAVDETCVVIFTIEFLTRMLTAPFARTKLLNRRFLLETVFTVSAKTEDASELSQTDLGRIQWSKFASNWWSFWKQPAAIVDLFTVLPYWIEVWFATSSDSNFIWLRLFRLLRVSRIFKLVQILNSDLGQLSDAQHLLANVFVQAFPAFILTTALLVFALIVFSALMYTVERGDWYPESVVMRMETTLTALAGSQGAAEAILHEARTTGGVFIRTQGDGFVDMSPFTSILSAFWWTLATITTVGYGDNTPITIGGKVVGSFAILYGTILLGLPIGIIGSQFSTEFARMVATNRINRSRHERNHQRKDEAEQSRGRSGLMSMDAGGAESAQTSPTTSPSKLKKKMSHRVVDTFRTVVRTSGNRALRGGEQVVSAAAKLHRLPLRPRQREQLISAKYAFEDLMKMHGESLGIAPETQQAWLDCLWATQFCAGPDLDRLSARILTFLSDAEMRRGGGYAQLVRLAWFDLCMACCSLACVLRGKSVAVKIQFEAVSG
eukprot:s953_g1.t4